MLPLLLHTAPDPACCPCYCTQHHAAAPAPAPACCPCCCCLTGQAAQLADEEGDGGELRGQQRGCEEGDVDVLDRRDAKEEQQERVVDDGGIAAGVEAGAHADPQVKGKET